MAEPQEVRTIDEWSEVFEFEILDPDGFDRTDPQLYERLFTKQEFEEKSAHSTVRFIKGDRAYRSPFNKMVRDEIPDLIMKEGKICKLRIVNGEEYQKTLKDKLLEEVNELLESSSKEEILEEAGDVRDVLCALVDSLTDSTHFTRDANRKLHQKGGFKKGYILVSVVDK